VLCLWALDVRGFDCCVEPNDQTMNIFCAAGRQQLCYLGGVHSAHLHEESCSGGRCYIAHVTGCSRATVLSEQATAVAGGIAAAAAVAFCSVQLVVRVCDRVSWQA
jgi:hypothetical protein